MESGKTGQIRKIRIENTQTPKRQHKGKTPHLEVALFSRSNWLGSLRVRTDQSLWSREDFTHEIRNLLRLGLKTQIAQERIAKRAAKQAAKKIRKTSPKSEELSSVIKRGDMWIRKALKKNNIKNHVIVTDVTGDTIQYQSREFKQNVKSRKAFIAKFRFFNQQKSAETVSANNRSENSSGNSVIDNPANIHSALVYRKAEKTGKDAIFLSASMPDPKHDYGYARLANSTAINSAIRAFLVTVLGRRHLILENHPSIMILITEMARDMDVDCNSCVTCVEHEFFHKETNDQFTSSIHEPRRIMIKGTTEEARETREQARTRMVREMFSMFDFGSAVFIGGAKNVFEEFDLFRKLNPHAAIIPVLSTGGATALLADRFESLPDDLESDLDYYRLFHDHLGISDESG